MRVAELIIDGFKSYAVRTHITGWDAEFNAITGLNGSGKSNILDAICFVLGIKNLSNVRVSNLNELVYKRGQAGINKASVTIVFDNSNREKSPVGYEKFPQISVTRQLIVGGRNKYLINGHTAQQHTVETFFQSVQLNVNNPHFLIMQGKITKVLNMKPPEILAMIEEAAGTRMFEERRDKALHTIAKKEKKLQEIMSLLEEEISPKLEKLRKEKRAYLEFQKTEVELDALKRLTTAHQYYEKARSLKENQVTLAHQQDRLAKVEEERDQLQREIRTLEQEMAQVNARREEELAKDGRLAGLESSVRSVEMRLVKVRAQRANAERGIEEESSTLMSMQAREADWKQGLELKEATIQENQSSFSELKEQEVARVEGLRRAEAKIQALSTGMSSDEGKETGFLEQLREAKEAVSKYETQVETTKMRMKHLKQRAKELRHQVQSSSKQDANMTKEREEIMKALQRIKDSLKALDWDPSREQLLREELTGAQRAVDEAEEEVRRIQTSGGVPFFQYVDPHPGFERSKVRGLVAELIHLPPEHSGKATAIQVAAGGALYNVVVEDEVVASSLIQRGQLRKRVTMIPLNKIASGRMDQSRVAAAQKLAPGKVDLALTLIGYPPEVERAMEHVFGHCLICPDSKTAAKVTFDPKVKMRSVTYDGDVYSPAGTLQGGSRAQGPSVLAKFDQLHRAKAQLKEAKGRLIKAEQGWAEAEGRMNQCRELERDLGLKEHQLTLLDRQLGGSVHGQAVQELAQVEESLVQGEKELEEAGALASKARETVVRTEKEAEEYQGDREGVLKRLRAQLTKDKALHARESSRFQEARAEAERATLELEQLRKDLTHLSGQIESQMTMVEEAKSSTKKYLVQEEELQEELHELSGKLQEEKVTLLGVEEEIRELSALVKGKAVTETELALMIGGLQGEVESLREAERGAQGIIRALERDHPWILEHRDRFGVQGGTYDFTSMEGGMHGVHARLRKLQAQFEGLRRSLNRSVITNLDSTEKREAQLRTMAQTVRRDKGKIEETITQLDEYKRAALEKTWEAVNKDFGEIFGTLLEGNTCKLEPIEGRDLSDGLEIKVCLGGVWKTSLTELSGGQRSLVALALILSMMQFKPAPMYILDEVDAALDPSHTQNIGQLFKTRFKGSQFIVVSLKDGMFANANVLFRTKFRDGVSVVERTEAKRKGITSGGGGISRASSRSWQR